MREGSMLRVGLSGVMQGDSRTVAGRADRLPSIHRHSRGPVNRRRGRNCKASLLPSRRYPVDGMPYREAAMAFAGAMTLESAHSSRPAGPAAPANAAILGGP